jgi:hypothetical protein
MNVSYAAINLEYAITGYGRLVEVANGRFGAFQFAESGFG